MPLTQSKAVALVFVLASQLGGCFMVCSEDEKAQINQALTIYMQGMRQVLGPNPAALAQLYGMMGIRMQVPPSVTREQMAAAERVLKDPPSGCGSYVRELGENMRRANQSAAVDRYVDSLFR